MVAARVQVDKRLKPHRRLSAWLAEFQQSRSSFSSATAQSCEPNDRKDRKDRGIEVNDEEQRDLMLRPSSSSKPRKSCTKSEERLPAWVRILRKLSSWRRFSDAPKGFNLPRTPRGCGMHNPTGAMPAAFRASHKSLKSVYLRNTSCVARVPRATRMRYKMGPRASDCSVCVRMHALSSEEGRLLQSVGHRALLECKRRQSCFA